MEYNGLGASILDVGLAQAKQPLNTTSHYFEIEIIDPGENCFIAIGLTEKVFFKVLLKVTIQLNLDNLTFDSLTH